MKYIGKIFLCALSSVIGTLVGGMFSSALHLEQPKLPGPMNMPLLVVLCLGAGLVLSLALAALSPWLPGKHWPRFAVVAWFVFAWLGINNTIEASIFTTMGGGPAVIVTLLVPSLSVAGAVVLLFGNRKHGKSFSDNLRRFFADRTVRQWALRFSLAVLAFPVVYFFFGMPVGLLVGKFYQNQSFGLQMPSLGVVIGVQFVRSLVALLAALPLLVVWPGSRQRFAWIFGLNLFVVAGLYGLIQAYWMPWTLRSIHTVELLLDSVVYGWLVAALLLPHATAHNPVPVEETGVRNHTI
ncbi:MAG: hypothetical protein ACLPRE_04615 [Limisphaerales bacterium]